MKRVLSWTFYALFSVVFTWVMIYVIFQNQYHESAYLIPMTVVCLAVLVLIYRALKKYGNISENRYRYILLVFCAVMFIIQVIISGVLEFDPVFDMGAVYHGAVEWVETGTFEGYYDYFSANPNNSGAMLFLFVIFKLCFFVGIENFFMTAAVVNSIMAVCTMAVVSVVCKRFGGVSHALFALVLFALSLPFYIIGAVFYTDALSLLFPVLAFYLYLKARDTEDIKKQILFYALMALSAAVGMQIKFTVAVVLAAIAIDLCFSFEPKRVAAAALSTAAVLVLVSVSVNGVLYSHLDRETVEQEDYPITHHIMMSFKGDGGYNAEDFEFTKSFDDVEERNEAVKEELFNRIENLGFAGIYDLFSVKASKDFGDGTYGFSDFLDDNPVNDSLLHEYVLYDGENYSKYSHFCTGMHIAVMLLMLFGSYGYVLVNKKKLHENLVPYLTVFGVFAFLMIWETNRRYFFNCLPMIFICAVMGAEQFNTAMLSLKDRIVTVIKGPGNAVNKGSEKRKHT